MSIRVWWVLMVPMAVIGCAHNASESVASKPGASSSRPGTAKASEVIDEGPASASAGAGSSVASAGPGQLIPFHSSGGFTVLMPANPLQENRTGQTPGGPVQVHVAQARDPSAQYVSTYSEFPPEAWRGEDPGAPRRVPALDARGDERHPGENAGHPARRASRARVHRLQSGRESDDGASAGGAGPGVLAGRYSPAGPGAGVGGALSGLPSPGLLRAARAWGQRPSQRDLQRQRQPDRDERPGGAPRGTEVPTGNADPSGPTPSR
jgi:hypothetical protein